MNQERIEKIILLSKYLTKEKISNPDRESVNNIQKYLNNIISDTISKKSEGIKFNKLSLISPLVFLNFFF
jgi:hypothetical protein